MNDQQTITVVDEATQRQATVDMASIPPDSRWQEFLGAVIQEMELPNHPSGYNGRVERLGERVNQSDRVLDSVQPGDRIGLEADVQLG